jgi:hypothetical protein
LEEADDKPAFDEVKGIVNLIASIKINVWIFEIKVFFYIQLSNIKLLP